MATTDTPKIASIGARAYESEHIALALVAKRWGLSRADVLRELVRNAARAAGFWPVTEALQETLDSQATGGELEREE